jgi:hypothetical protein
VFGAILGFIENARSRRSFSISAWKDQSDVEYLNVSEAFLAIICRRTPRFALAGHLLSSLFVCNCAGCSTGLRVVLVQGGYR